MRLLQVFASFVYGLVFLSIDACEPRRSSLGGSFRTPLFLVKDLTCGFCFSPIFFPPNGYGGYEQLCLEVAVELANRGHAVSVFTSGVGLQEPEHYTGIRVYRRLQLEVVGGLVPSTMRMLLHRRRIDQENQRALNEIVTTEVSDIALVWGMWNVPRSVPARYHRR